MVATARRRGGVGETQQGEEDLETTTAHLFDSFVRQGPSCTLRLAACKTLGKQAEQSARARLNSASG